jgi:hypothetical protein
LKLLPHKAFKTGGASVHSLFETIAVISIIIFLHPTNSTAQIPARVVHISGTIVDTNGSSIESAQVSLKQNQRTLETTSSDQQGRFELATNELGDLSIEVECPGFDSFTILSKK